jgi:hypothetical protein
LQSELATSGTVPNNLMRVMMRAAVRFESIQGLSQIYDQLRAHSPKAELEVIGRLLRIGQYAHHIYRDSDAATEDIN